MGVLSHEGVLFVGGGMVIPGGRVFGEARPLWGCLVVCESIYIVIIKPAPVGGSGCRARKQNAMGICPVHDRFHLFTFLFSREWWVQVWVGGGGYGVLCI